MMEPDSNDAPETPRNPALEPYRIPSLPPSFYYIPNFITPEEEASIPSKIPANRWTHLTHRRLQAHPSTLTSNNTLLGAPLPPYLDSPIIPKFKELGVFARTKHGGPNHVLINEYKRGEGIMPHEDGSAYDNVVATVSLGGTLCLDISQKPSSQPSNEEIRNTNEDAETEELSTPSGADAKAAEAYVLPTRILQERRSLLITTGVAYRDLLHGIAPLERDEDLGQGTVANWGLLGERRGFEESGGRSERGTRVSLTYRDVLKVSKAGGLLRGLGR